MKRKSILVFIVTKQRASNSVSIWLFRRNERLQNDKNVFLYQIKGCYNTNHNHYIHFLEQRVDLTQFANNFYHVKIKIAYILS